MNLEDIRPEAREEIKKLFLEKGRRKKGRSWLIAGLILAALNIWGAMSVLDDPPLAQLSAGAAFGCLWVLFFLFKIWSTSEES